MFVKNAIKQLKKEMNNTINNDYHDVKKNNSNFIKIRGNESNVVKDTNYNNHFLNNYRFKEIETRLCRSFKPKKE